MMQDGTFSSRMVAGPSCFQHWLLSYRVLRTTLVMMDQVGLANLMQWENKIETLNNRYEDCWHLIAEADDRGRGEQMSKTLSKIKMAIDAGDPPPRGWDPSRPWEVVWRTVLNDQDYWREQVHLPAMVWMAKGSKGVAMAPDEEIIKEREKGRRDNAESSLGGDPGEVKKLSNRAKKEARKRKWAAEKEELKNLRRKREIWKRWRRKAWWSRPRWVWQSRRRRMLRLEQWEWPMRWIAARVTVQRKGAEVAPLHGVQVTGPPFERVPTEEGIWWLKMMGWFGWTPLRGKAHAGDEEASSSSQPPQVPKAEKGTKRKRFTGGDPPDKKEAPKDHIFVEPGLRRLLWCQALRLLAPLLGARGQVGSGCKRGIRKDRAESDHVLR